MTYSRTDKQIAVMYKLLIPRGWHYAFWRGSGIFVKNHCTFVISEMLPENPTVRNTASNDVVVGVCLKVHGDNSQWWLEKDGFLMRDGQFSQAFTRLYDDSYFYGEDKENAEAFADEIDWYATASDVALVSAKYREIASVGATVNVPAAAPEGVGATLSFILRPGTEAAWNNGLKDGVIYKIIAADEHQAVIAPYDNNFVNLIVEDRISFPAEQFSAILQSEQLIAVKLTEQASGTEYHYQKIIPDERNELNQSFNEFNLSPSQQAAIAWAIGKGFNFTPFLDNQLTPKALKAYMTMLENAADVSIIVGKSLTADHLEFLAKLAEKDVPFNAFLDASGGIEALERKFIGMSETINDWIYGMSETQKKVARREAFKLRDYKKYAKEGTLPRVMLFAEAEGKYRGMAKCLLEKGVDLPTHTKVAWVSLTEEEKDTVLEYFKAPGAVIAGKSFNEFLLENRNSIISFYYWSKEGFILFLPKCYVKVDYNSVYVLTFERKVLWRGVYVNEKFYYFSSPDLNSVL